MLFSKYFLKLCYLAKKGLILFIGVPKSAPMTQIREVDLRSPIISSVFSLWWGRGTQICPKDPNPRSRSKEWTRPRVQQEIRTFDRKRTLGIRGYINCKVEFSQPSCWLYSVPNLLVFQQLVTLYLGGILVRVVSEIV